MFPINISWILPPPSPETTPTTAQPIMFMSDETPTTAPVALNIPTPKYPRATTARRLNCPGCPSSANDANCDDPRLFNPPSNCCGSLRASSSILRSMARALSRGSTTFFDFALATILATLRCISISAGDEGRFILCRMESDSNFFSGGAMYRRRHSKLCLRIELGLRNANISMFLCAKRT